MFFGLRLKHGEYLSRFEVRNAIYSFCPLPYYEHVCSDFVNLYFPNPWTKYPM